MNIEKTEHYIGELVKIEHHIDELVKLVRNESNRGSYLKLALNEKILFLGIRVVEHGYLEKLQKDSEHLNQLINRGLEDWDGYYEYDEDWC